MGGPQAVEDGEVEGLAAAAAEAMSHAAEALSALLGVSVRPGPPQVTRLPAASAARTLREAPVVETALYFSVTGDPEGALLVFFPPGGARTLATHLTGRLEGGAGILGSREGSALKEAGNILASAYLWAASRWAGMALKPSIPHLALDWGRAVADGALHGLLPAAGTVLLAEVPFGDDRLVRGRVIWLPGTRTRGGLTRGHGD
jgi:chemotaxis protein CheC